MTPNQLLATQPDRITTDLDPLLSYGGRSHIPEIAEHEMGALYNAKQTAVRIAIYKEFNFDHRRFWRLASVWFHEKPVMIIRNAGREGEDHVSRFIIDRDQYALMVSYLKTLLPVEPDRDVVSPTGDIPDLTSFYGNDLHGHFQRSDHW